MINVLLILATMFAVLSVFLNTRSGKAADKCLYAAYTILFVAVVLRWNIMTLVAT